MTAQPDQTVSLLELLELSNNERLGRATDAAERAAAALERIADTAAALERIADAADTFIALFASVIGTGMSICNQDNGDTTYPSVNFIRSGRGKRDFECDADNEETD